MKVNYNIQAMVAQRALNANEKKLAASTERLSSGYKINHAKDDAAGMAISKKMKMQIRGLEQANDNAENGISVCETADGALAEIEEMLQRMNELAVKASNGTCTSTDRAAIEEEATQLQNEITRIATQTDFNGATLLDGTFDLRGYTDKSGVSIVNYSDNVPVGTYEIQITTVGDDTTNPKTDAVVTILGSNAAEGGEAFVNNASIQADGNTVTLTDHKGKSITFDIDPTKFDPTQNPVTLDITGIGAFSVQVGANEGQLLDMRIPEVSLNTLGISELNMSTEEDARNSIALATGAIDKISSIRAKLGAYQNRLEHTTNNLNVSTENMTAALSRITDLDMSEEMVDYTTRQVLVQAGTSMLTQANSQPEQALQLLQ